MPAPQQARRVALFVGALQVCVPIALGALAGIVDGSPTPVLQTLVVVEVVVVAVEVRAIDPRFRISVWEIAVFPLSLILGFLLLWVALAMFEIGFFTPFVLGVGERGLHDIREFSLDTYSEARLRADREFVQVFGQYLVLAGLASVPIGGVAGFLGYVSRWLPI